MTALGYNPLATVHALEAAGVERNQAEAIAEGIRDAASADRADLATKADLLAAIEPLATKAELAEVRNELRAELAEVRNELRAELAEARNEHRADLAEARNELRAEIHRNTETLRSELRWILGFLAALILAMAAKLFGIV